MKLIDKITDSAIQTVTLIGNPNQSIELTLRYMPASQSWVMDVVYDDFSLYGVRVVANPNLLRQYKNKIPFGLLCTTAQPIDPYRINDFDTGYAKLYLMDADDVEEIETRVYE